MDESRRLKAAVRITQRFAARMKHSHLADNENERSTLGALELFLKRARQRHLVHLAWSEAALAAAAGLAVCTSLLLLGTQILNWYWPVLLFLAVLAAGGVRMSRSVPSMYKIAQRIDRHLGLRDALPTAFYLRGGAAENAVHLDAIEAPVLAAIGKPRAMEHAVPFILPRTVYAFAGALACATLIFGIRYGITRSLDLRAPIAFAGFDAAPDVAQAKTTPRKSAIQERLDEQLRQMGISVQDEQGLASEQDRATDSVSALASPDGEIPIESQEGTQSSGEKGKGQGGSEKGEGSEQADASAPGDASNQGEQQSAAGAGQQAEPQNPPAPSTNPAAQNSSLMDKMKDAMSNLLSKMKPQSQPQSQQASSGAQGSSPQARSEPSPKGMQGQSRSDGEGQPSPEKGEQDGEGDDLQASNSRSGEKNSDRPGNQDAKSGMGKQDGSKEIQEAEQLAAMGKISELLGRRSAQVTGEMTIEVPSGKQQLRTSYSQKKALHADAGAEVARDEIPLAYQHYVQRYFEEVRKAPGKARN